MQMNVNPKSSKHPDMSRLYSCLPYYADMSM